MPRVAALPGIEGVAVSNDLPLEGDDTTTGVSTADGHAPFERGHQPLIGVQAVNSGYFHTMGIPLLRGRELSVSDTMNSPLVVVINQKLADTLWPGQDPIGKHFNVMTDKQSEVVGVVGNVLHNGLAEPVSAESYVPFAQNPWAYVCLAIRAKGNPTAVNSAMRSLLSDLDPELRGPDFLEGDNLPAAECAICDLRGIFCYETELFRGRPSRYMTLSSGIWRRGETMPASMPSA